MATRIFAGGSICFAVVLTLASTALAMDERDAFRDSPDYFAKRLEAFSAALASGDAERVSAFQPSRDAEEEIPAEALEQFRRVCKDVARFMKTPAGKFHATVLRSFPAIESLPPDLRSLELDQEFELRDPDSRGLVHGMSFAFRFEWDERKRTWVVPVVEVEFESADERSGMTSPEADLAPVSLSGVLGALFSGEPAEKVLEAASSEFVTKTFALFPAPPTHEGVMAARIESLARGLDKRDLDAVVALVVTGEGADTKGKQEVFRQALEAHEGIGAEVRSFPRANGILPALVRMVLRAEGGKRRTSFEMVREDVTWQVADVTLDAEGREPFSLSGILSRL